jgi:hypothetical protein
MILSLFSHSTASEGDFFTKFSPPFYRIPKSKASRAYNDQIIRKNRERNDGSEARKSEVLRAM